MRVASIINNIQTSLTGQTAQESLAFMTHVAATHCSGRRNSLFKHEGKLEIKTQQDTPQIPEGKHQEVASEELCFSAWQS